jgi:hypothetical protein
MTKLIIPVLAIVSLAAANATAADSMFVGSWKLNAEKSKMTGLQEKIEDLGGGEFKFDFGDDVETIMLDGKDHMTKYGSTWAVTPEGPEKWKSVHKRDGKITSTATWTVSDEGKMFTSETDGTRPDGSTYHNTFKAKRVGGDGTGLAATWESTEMKLGSPEDWEIKPFESDGLSFVTPALKEVDDVKFDGKEYADKGPSVAPESTTSGKQIDERTLELYQKLKGKLLVTQHLELSEDGKVLTDTLHFPGMDQTETDVYEKK